MNGDESSYRAYLADNGWTSTIEISALTPASLRAALDAIQPMATNPLDGLADLLAERLPMLALPAARGSQPAA